ncbi:hypothetical protein FMM58_03300 [Campylobacter sp. LR291e]|uniref:hypothetical protein n=1 Tax=unclassified Campylobacter TaxID=2593542 RepID=UPI001237BDB2|nr:MULTISPECIES: hypothetical protein [unclassified Campylobacter]KAA6225204.1 hypothetical protein FMM55_07985 [Campylobacter sp. LR196d]KAA6226216.1 hypothetical protein FMM54_05360 [Campylobacter sp. LR185c]KAA6231417.1 hypothetical protein FMM56_04510 [Campylobacter sp. LR264d]KAA6231629.1 hypothetical protein FMM58_03300 [Campylobacter sp. LR291e]KAA8604714.1 hypothetical protein CGP82_01995 [Campylobacter sp. LR185c]
MADLSILTSSLTSSTNLLSSTSSIETSNAQSFYETLTKQAEALNAYLPDRMKISETELLYDTMKKLENGDFASYTSSSSTSSIIQSVLQTSYAYEQILTLLESFQSELADFANSYVTTDDNTSNLLTQLLEQSNTTKTLLSALVGQS